MRKMCKTCKHWARKEGTLFGRCRRCHDWAGLYTDPDKVGYKPDEFGSRDADMYGSSLETGEDFSCIHYNYREGYLADLLKLDPSESSESAD